MKIKRRKAIKCTWLSSIAAFVIVGISCASVTKQNQVQGTYENNKRVIVTAISDRVIHVQHKIKDQQDIKSLIVPRKEILINNGDGDAKSIRTNQLEVRLDVKTGKVSFFKAEGDKIISESGWSLAAQDGEEYNLFKSEQRWEADESEAYYGLGQFYKSHMNYQNKKMIMEHLNRDTVFPLVISSAGYAILWDVNCISKFDATAKGEISFSADSTFNSNYYLIYGPEYDTIISEVRKLTRFETIFPKWVRGYILQNYPEQFDELCQLNWKEMFFDSCTTDWQKHWALDGLKAKLINNNNGMEFWAGPVFEESASHAVLWTKKSFEGNLRIDYEYTKLDTMTDAVNILYIQATGSGIDGYSKDISEWADKRTIPEMKIYFNHMNAYHISYAAFGADKNGKKEEYIRARRYQPEANGLNGTDLEPDYFDTGLFRQNITYHITVIKKNDDLFMQISNEQENYLCHWRTDNKPRITEGKIGLRHMWTRGSRYKNFRVSQL